MIAIVDYDAGNVKSVQNAFDRLGATTTITDNADTLLSADKIIFPGVGEAKTAMNQLKKRNLDQLIFNLKQPFLGICLGLQLMCKHSEEGDTSCLGIFDVDVKKFDKSLNVPHMGWNNFTTIKGKLFENISIDEDVYFVHSYYAEISQYTVAQTNYSTVFSAAMQKDNFYAVQFHPEKSAAPGEKILRNFLSL